MVLAQEETFDGGLLVVDERHHDFTVLGVLSGFADRQIAVQDSGIFHRIAFNTQRKEVLAAKDGGIQHRAAVPFRLGVHRQTGRDTADDRNLPPALRLPTFRGPGLKDRPYDCSAPPVSDNLFPPAL